MCVCVCVCVYPVESTCLRPHGLQPTRLLCSWSLTSKNTEVDSHFLLQGILLTQDLNLCLLHWQVDPLPLNHLGNHLPTSTDEKTQFQFLLQSIDYQSKVMITSSELLLSVSYSQTHGYRVVCGLTDMKITYSII